MLRQIFVTGASGFIGQNLIKRHPESSDYSIKVLTRRPLPEFASDGRPQQVLGNLLDPETYQTELAGSDAVVHLAAVTGRAARDESQRVNVEGTRVLLQACRAAGVSRFLHISTIAAGYPDQRHYSYAQSKAQAERLVRESGLDFAIIRPTVVIGEQSPLWNTLLKIAGLPIVPLPEGARSVRVQPIHVKDVVRGIELLLESERFDGEVLELGGPQPLTLREFLGLIQKALRGAPSRILRVPLGPIRALLAAMEPTARPLMPVTAGQFALFANDSVVSDNWLHDQVRRDMQSTEETIASLVVSGNGDAGRRKRIFPGQQFNLMRESTVRILEEECRSFAAYLIGLLPSPYVEEQYTRAAQAHKLGFDEDLSCFDRVTLRLARRGSIFARCADSYCALFHRAGALRRKLIVLAAILESVSPTNESFDRLESRRVAFTALSLVGYGLTFAVSLLLGAVVLFPADLLCRIVTYGRSSTCTGRVK
jgi:nucleoside-diphosphate-sugar epimerase